MFADQRFNVVAVVVRKRLVDVDKVAVLVEDAYALNSGFDNPALTPLGIVGTILGNSRAHLVRQLGVLVGTAPLP